MLRCPLRQPTALCGRQEEDVMPRHGIWTILFASLAIIDCSHTTGSGASTSSGGTTSSSGSSTSTDAMASLPCTLSGEDCSTLGCCSGVCSQGSCACSDHWDNCQQNSQCCSGVCADGACAACNDVGKLCTEHANCCSGVCSNGVCVEACSVQFNGSCTLYRECCQGSCTNGVCCTPSGYAGCVSDEECCSGNSCAFDMEGHGYCCLAAGGDCNPNNSDCCHGCGSDGKCK